MTAPQSATLSQMNIYPIKSMGTIAIRETQVEERGLRFDRRFMLIDEQNRFLSQRELPKMATIRTAIEVEEEKLTLTAPGMSPLILPASPDRQPILRVLIWRDPVAAHPVDPMADAWLSEYLGRSVRLVHMHDSSGRSVDPAYGDPEEIVSFADGFPLLLASESSLADLNRRLAEKGKPPIPMSRFRPNLVISGTQPYAEDHWTEITIGVASFRAVKPCARCQITTIDQNSGQHTGPEPLKTLGSYRNTDLGVTFGVNLIPMHKGVIRLGDPLHLGNRWVYKPSL